MADSVEDPMENSGDEDQEIDRPPTPDYHDHEDKPEDDVFSDISDDEDKEKLDSKQDETPVVTDSPVSDTSEHDNKEKDSEEFRNITSVDNDSEKEEIEAVDSENHNVDNTETMYNDGDDNENDTLEKETEESDLTEQEKTVSPVDNSESVPDTDVKLITSDEEKNSSNDEEETVEKNKDDEETMPVSPIGLGLSEPDTEIVEDILKKDVEEICEENSEEGKEEDIEESKKEEEDIQEDEEEKVEKSVSDQEEDEEKPSTSEDVDIPDDERSEPDEEGGDQLIQDIFGASDEEEEFEGFDQDEIEISRPKQDVPSTPSKSMISDDEDEGVSGEVESMSVPKPKDTKEGEESDSDDEERSVSETVWDFDIMMEQKKASRAKKRRRRGDSELISDSDDLVVDMVKQMKQAAEDDKILNEAKQAATKKLKLLPLVLTHLNKADLQFTFIDSGILNALKDWLSPLPDGSLPHLQIRTGLLKILSSFPALDTGALKMSGLGKAIMYIYRHPKEIRQNKNIAGKLINEWARPIFGVTSNFKSMSREEREERDYQNMSKRRRLSSTEEGGRTPRSIDRALQGEKKAARPGEKGFIMRARVPTPSNKDYVVRPKSSLEALDFQRVNKVMSRADKQMRKFKDRNKSKAPTHAATISIEGRKMSL